MATPAGLLKCIESHRRVVEFSLLERLLQLGGRAFGVRKVLLKGSCRTFTDRSPGFMQSLTDQKCLLRGVQIGMISWRLPARTAAKTQVLEGSIDVGPWRRSRNRRLPSPRARATLHLVAALDIRPQNSTARRSPDSCPRIRGIESTHRRSRRYEPCRRWPPRRVPDADHDDNGRAEDLRTLGLRESESPRPTSRFHRNPGEYARSEVRARGPCRLSAAHRRR